MPKKIIISEEVLTDNNILIIKKGTELFHGTGEQFKKEEASPGMYDNVFWTTTDSIIAQTYIPVSGSIIFTTSEQIARPNKHSNLQNSLGIYYTDVEFQGTRASSYREAAVFERMGNFIWHLQDKAMKKEKELKEFAKYFEEKQKNNFDDITDEDIEKYEQLESELEELIKKEREYNLEKYKNEYVNKKLKSLGYIPTNVEDSFKSNMRWRLKQADGKLKPADYKMQGRLFIVTPKKDLRIYDTTDGGKREGDLTDVDYHKHRWFEEAEKKGFDGIQITDFAQSEDMGNVGHLSIGLFKNTLKFVEIEEISATHQELRPHYGSGDFESTEYKQYKNKLR